MADEEHQQGATAQPEIHGNEQNVAEDGLDVEEEVEATEERAHVGDAVESAAGETVSEELETQDHDQKPPTPPKDDHNGQDVLTPQSYPTNGYSIAAPDTSQGTPISSTPGTPSQNLPYTPRQRTDSQSTTATNATRSTVRSTRSSMVFVVAALESIAASKDARKRKALQDSTQRALSAIRSAQGDAAQINPEVMFEPLNLATEAPTASVVTTALDCIGKLISYSYFSAPPAGSEASQRTPLIERAIDTICDCFQGEATPAEVQMQIIKSLLAAILNDKIIVHGAGLLKSVRQTYNIFLLSKSSANQQIAQGTLTQMVNTVFDRVKVRLASKAARVNSSKSSLAGTNGSADAAHSNGERGTPTIGGFETPTTAEPETPSEERGQPKMTLAALESRKSFDDAKITDSAPTTVSRAKREHRARQPSRTESGHEIPAIVVQGEGSEAPSEDEEEDEIYAKDAYLVFRAMCKLSTKALRPEDAVDNKSQGMRSKLLSLHIVHTLIFNSPNVFTSPHSTIRNASSVPAQFTQAVKQYLLPVLARNASSSAHRVFEVSAEIFALMVRYLRSLLKMEIEVCFREIYFPILEKRVAPGWQKSYIMQHIFERIASDPKALVEIYLNYDCGKGMDNIYQRIIEHTSRAAGQPVSVTGVQQQAYSDKTAAQNAGLNDWRERGTLPPSLATANMGASAASEADRIYQDFPPEYALKMQSLECLVETLRSMVNWAQQGVTEAAASTLQPDGESRLSSDDLRESTDTRGEPNGTPSLDGAPTGDAPASPSQPAEDDPAELERIKQHKTALNNAVKQFNFKPKRGIKLLISDGFIPSSDPTDIARFLLNSERIDKKSLGEFLGEGDEDNIKIMHAFVDQMDFTRTRFVDALRRFLQSFRLPGEAQKIDRLMLKFAERYLAGNPAAFANADTAYVLSYSTIMLNTDQHSANVKIRMTPEDFIKNNRGINDNADLPDEYLRGIYVEIVQNEIVLDTEREKAANLGQTATQAPVGGIVSALANVGRDLQREAYAQASDEMSSRTELLFKNLLKAQKRSASATGEGAAGKGRYLTASSFKHVGPMFDQAWMSFLTALSGSAQETQNLETIRLAMEGHQKAIRIACVFDLEDPRQAFVQSLAQATKLDNLSEMKVKNLEALKVLLGIAWTEGNLLKESWRVVLTCISQLDRFQLISSGVEEGAVPNMLRASTPGVSQTNGAGARRSVQLSRRPTQQRAPPSGVYQPEIAAEAQNASMVRVVDRIFTNTATLSGEAIVHFVRALTLVSWQEIESSGQSESPRTYSLQKLVEISGYNMLRVRFEWTRIWEILGQHFIDVGCHNNTHVVYFALNSLRQLSMRFMEIEELPGFKFQKDFLKPFELILANSRQVMVKEFVLRCLIQMIQARGDMIRSGWRTMFGVFTVAAREEYEGIVNLAFDNVTQVYNERFGVVISQGAFADLVVCLTEFSKNQRFQKKSLQAIETLRSSVPKMLRTPECPLSQHAIAAEFAQGMEKPQAEGLARQPTRQSQEEQYWFPVLFAFHDVLMTGEDLEVRSRALNYLFDTLTRYGGEFPTDFWDTLWRQLLYPIFIVLKDRKAINHEAANHEELSVWLSTTLIQALRNMITLFTHFFEALEYMLDRFLDLLALCICQENDTLARIGSNCLQQLILQNVKKFSPAHWDRIVGAFVDLFARTEARELFSAAASGYRRESESVNGLMGATMTSDDASGIASGANALRINGLPAETPSETHTVNGDSQLAPLRTELSHTLSLSDSDMDRDVSPAPSKRSELEDFAATAKHQQPVPVTAARRRYFNQIITKCVLQLLMIETVSELFNNDAVYASIPSHLLLRLMALLKKSYHFAKRFNEDRDLRTRLFRESFMKQPPNLLKQESGSASVYVGILLRMYKDDTDERVASRADTEAALIPLCSDIVASYIELDEETQQRNIVTWRPVVIDVLEGYVGFADAEFGKHVEIFAPLAVGLMNREMGPELQRAVQTLWQRVCEVRLGIDRERLGDVVPASATRETPMSPKANVFGGRRGTMAVHTKYGHFQKLPPELRTLIYRIVLSNPDRLPAVVRTTIPNGPTKYKAYIQALTGVCHSIRHEFLSIHYAESTFFFKPGRTIEGLGNITQVISAFKRAVGDDQDKLQSLAAVVMEDGDKVVSLTSTKAEDSEKAVIEYRNDFANEEDWTVCECPIRSMEAQIEKRGSDQPILLEALNRCCVVLLRKYYNSHSKYSLRQTCPGCGGCSNWS
ncbi:guanine nucleotide exchange protein for ADP-robosylation factor [Elasticomyces elasticus]|nr:guanine nucleotide exchange protein for ADP-robosylation factor [Elasticomyces elasticus]KAK5738412.1 guanine nucleotide exchange protein for ADP-robosylation factor [Elasticomyces elasticus]